MIIALDNDTLLLAEDTQPGTGGVCRVFAFNQSLCVFITRTSVEFVGAIALSTRELRDNLLLMADLPCRNAILRDLYQKTATKRF